MASSSADRTAPLPRLAAGRVLWALAAVVVAVNAVVFPAALRRLGPQPAAWPLDLRPSYSADDAYRTFAAMGDAGRRAYLLVETTVDVVYPVAYTLLLGGLLARLLPRAGRGLAWLPVAVLVADLLENAGIVAMLVRFPRPLDAIAPVASACTTAKWALLAVTLLLLAAALVAWAVRRARE